MDPEVKQWIESSPLAPETKAALLAEAGKDENAQFIKQSVMMRSDYSRKQDELTRQMQAKQEEVEREMQKAQDLVTANTTWRTQEETKYQQALARARAAEAERLKLQQTLRDNYGVSDETLKALGLDKVQVEPPATPPTNQNDNPQYLTPDEAKKLGRDVGYEAVMANAQVYDLGIEHQRLFGKPLENSRELINYALENKLTLEDAFEKKYNASARREELAQQQRQKEIADAVEAAKRDWESSARVNGGRKAGEIRQGPVFQIKPDGQQGEQAAPPVASEVAAQQNRVAHAAQAYHALKSQQQ